VCDEREGVNEDGTRGWMQERDSLLELATVTKKKE
jgi:hypothetical protein